ncbi:DNA helicase II [Pseudomarimonas arenosa]|uniref:DNA 3'-5' helicase n=1 Tax=Pseudomarimonas arenosa TaxID=2774145 RepID=A0AAW3ZKG4_9GAMM|nr:DNA helicase II [Pseudomarimonas arenosa]MBD8526238.1 DNA helicase II [Pseudomarimonas arenosa]
MDSSLLLDGLNDAQREAVCAPLGHHLILAGAGSGKTRVLVHRIGWLMAVEQVPPHSILAVTFTNKAAAEMRGRIGQLSGHEHRGMWIGTFHSVAHRLLRLHWRDAGLPEGFQIIDSDDQLRLVKQAINNLQLDDKLYPPRQLCWYINQQKDEGRRARHLQARDAQDRRWIDIYSDYEAACQRGGLVDFAELLLRAHELLREHPALLEHYQQRFREILVDEFQDTNAIQYAFVQLLTGTRGHCLAVGDDDQAIYGWRGAKVENVHRFLRDYPGAQQHRLEQNYRSTGTILRAANAVIARNDGRLGKNLWTESGDGEPILLFAAYNEIDEARFVAERIRAWIEAGGAASDCAVLYRSNAQSRALEEALIAVGLPYRIHGGLRFFERAEIKDALAYLRLITNRHDDPAFERAVNTPSRGIGSRTLELIRSAAFQHGVSLWEACLSLLQAGGLSGRARSAVHGFCELIESIAGAVSDKLLAEQIDLVLKQSGLLAHYSAESRGTLEAREDNLNELVTVASRFVMPVDEVELPELLAFLSYAALEAGESQAEAHEDCVQLMTLHSAKGLEFPQVFVTGLEEGLFPSHRSVENDERLAEERRLAYVGITRAEQRLVLSYAECRRLHGSDTFNLPSRFLSEIPGDLYIAVRAKPQVERPQYSAPASRFKAMVSNKIGGFWQLGDRVRHMNFGSGTIIGAEGEGAHTRVQVNFDQGGSKWLVLSFARLEKEPGTALG